MVARSPHGPQPDTARAAGHLSVHGVILKDAAGREVARTDLPGISTDEALANARHIARTWNTLEEQKGME